MLSESQERMLICVKAGAEERVKELFKKYDLDAVTIGEVTDDGLYRLYHHGEEVANLPVDALAEDAPVYEKAVQGESSENKKPPVFLFSLPSRSLVYEKAVQM